MAAAGRKRGTGLADDGAFLAGLQAQAHAEFADQLVEKIAECRDDPFRFVMFVYPWGEEGSPLHDQDGPDDWQREFLEAVGRAVRERTRMPDLGAYLAGTASGHGVGKTALVAWLIHWFSSTRIDPAIVVTANTASQLTTKTWRELAKWHRLSINNDWFQWTATKFYLKGRPDTHYASAIPWSKERAEAFAGTHAKDVLLIFDEASAIADEIWEVAEGALTTAGALWFVFGNPTKNTGRFRECFRQFRQRWAMMKVDSRTAKKANKGQIQKWADDYGEDSDFFRVRVRGEFPRAASEQFISGDLVEMAQERYKRRFADTVTKEMAGGPGSLLRFKLEDNVLAPRIFVVDVARFGDDQTVFAMRCGRTFVVLAKFREMDTVQVTARAAEWINEEQPDHIFVDGVGVGGGVVDGLRSLGYEVEDVQAGARALEPRRFFNRRAEMWDTARNWLKTGMIPHDDKELFDDLTGPEYGFAREMQLQLESKDDMRSRGRPSPDVGDCLAMSFWMPVGIRPQGSRTVAEAMAEVGRQQRHVGGTTWASN